MLVHAILIDNVKKIDKNEESTCTNKIWGRALERGHAGFSTPKNNKKITIKKGFIKPIKIEIKFKFAHKICLLLFRYETEKSFNPSLLPKCDILVLRV